MITETLRVTNSALYIIECTILFSANKSISGLIVIQSWIYITNNSVLEFRRVNASTVGLIQSILILDENSTMIFTQNSADSKVFVIYLLNSHVHVINGSTLYITNNTLTNESAMLACNDSSVTVSGGILLFENNECQYYSQILLATNTAIIWEKGSLVNFTRNTVDYESSILFHSGGLMDFSESLLVISNNSMTNGSAVLYYIISSLTFSAAKLLFENNNCIYVSSLFVADSSAARFEMGTWINSSRNEMYCSSASIYFTSSVSDSRMIVTINYSILVMTNNFMTYSSTGFFCEKSACILSGVEFLFKENECHQNFATLMKSSYAITKLEKGSFVNFTHNKIHGVSFIFTNSETQVYVDGSSLTITNNFMNISHGFWCQSCDAFVLSAAALLFKDNECEKCFFVSNITITLEKQSLLSLTHNDIKNSAFLSHVGTDLVISESSVVITDNSLSCVVLQFENSSLIFSSGKLLTRKEQVSRQFKPNVDKRYKHKDGKYLCC